MTDQAPPALRPKNGRALASVPTRDLKLLLQRLHSKALHFPVTHFTLVQAGLPHLVDKVPFLHGLHEQATRAVLVAVLAERAHSEPAPAASE